MTDLQEKYADKIRKLLDKAEDQAATPAEAEAFTEKAVILMERYAVEWELVNAACGKEKQEEIIRKEWWYKSSYHQGLWEIGAAIARAQNCKILVRREKNASLLVLLGFESDVEKALMLDASLQIQAKAALKVALRDGQVHSEYWMTAMQKFKEKRQFYLGFADGIEDRLHRARKLGEEEFKSSKVREGHDQAEVSNKMALVVRSRQDRLDDWYDKKYGHLRSARGGIQSYGSTSSHGAGHRAGMNADTGSAGRVGQRRALNR